MRESILSSHSAWPAARVEKHLESHTGPLRLAVNTREGFPIVCSLWFEYRDGRLLCATQRDSRVARLLVEDGRCGFEAAPNEPPYMGVRGRGRATVSSHGAAELLGRLVDRFLGSRDSELAQWLLGRTDQEVAIAIEPEWVSSWDYSQRM